MLYVLNFLCFFSEHNWLLKVFVRGTKIRRSSRTARFENRQVDVFYSLHTPFSSVFYAQKKGSPKLVCQVGQRRHIASVFPVYLDFLRAEPFYTARPLKSSPSPSLSCPIENRRSGSGHRSVSVGVRLQEATPGDQLSFALVRRQELRPGRAGASPSSTAAPLP